MTTTAKDKKVSIASPGEHALTAEEVKAEKEAKDPIAAPAVTDLTEDPARPVDDGIPAEGGQLIVPPEVKAGDEVFYYSHDGIFTATVVEPRVAFDIVSTDKKGEPIYQADPEGLKEPQLQIVTAYGPKLRIVKKPTDGSEEVEHFAFATYGPEHLGSWGPKE
jgi:hypothetical protein